MADDARYLVLGFLVVRNANIMQPEWRVPGKVQQVWQ